MEDIRTEIEGLIKRAKALPNSLGRNKVVSKLEDARAAATQMLVDENNRYSHPPARNQPQDCTCGPGYIDGHCPIHGDSIQQP